VGELNYWYPQLSQLMGKIVGNPQQFNRILWPINMVIDPLMAIKKFLEIVTLSIKELWGREKDKQGRRAS